MKFHLFHDWHFKYEKLGPVKWCRELQPQCIYYCCICGKIKAIDSYRPV